MRRPSDNAGTSRPRAVDIYAGYLQALSRGEAPDFDSWCQRYPAEAGELRALHELVTLARTLAAVPSLQGRLSQQYAEEAVVTVSLRDETDEETVGTAVSAGSAAELPGGSPATQRYSVETEVGRGGMGVVYRVRDRQLNRTLAMKLRSRGKETPLTATERMGLARFLEEAQITAQLDHPGVVAVYDLGLNEEGQLYFTMKLVKGRDLGQIFEQARKGEAGWNLPRAVGVLVKACQALAYGHSKGVIHRDLKPANIMVGRFGEVYVMDWGLAKVVGQKDLHDLRPAVSSGVTYTSIKTDRESAAAATPDSPLITMDGSVVGTPAYMSPEQAQGKVDEVEAQSDVYSMGAILYNLLTGQPPYVEPGTRLSPHTILAMVIQGPPKAVLALNPKAPPELIAICNQAMNRDKATRYRNCFELAEDLQAFLDHRVVQAYRTGAVAELRSWISRNRLTAAVGAAALTILVFGTAGWSLWQRENALQARQQLARTYLRQGQAMCQAGDVHAGLHWLVRSLRECPARYEALVAVIQQNILGWSRQSSQLLQLLHHMEVDPTARLDAGLSAPLFALRPDGEQLVSAGGKDRTARLWSLRTGEPIGKPMAHATDILTLLYTENGAAIVTVAQDAVVRRWTARGDELGSPTELGASVQKWASLTSHNLLAVALSDGSIRVLSINDPPTPVFTQTMNREVSALFLADDGRKLLVGFNNGSACLLPIPEGPPLNLTAADGRPVSAVAFSPDGRFLATGRADGEVRLWSADTGQPIGQVMPHAAAASVLRFSPDSTVLAVAVGLAGDNSVHLWRVPGCVALGEPLRHQSFVYSLQFSPDGRRLATGGRDFYARLWSVGSGRPIVKGIPHHGVVGQVGFTPDGQRLIVSSMGTIEIWSSVTERAADGILRTESPDIWAADFSPDGRHVLLGGGRGFLQLWSTATREAEVRMEGLPMCWDTAFAGDGNRILAVGFGGAHLRTVGGGLLHAVAGPSHTYRSCAWHPDGKRVAMGSFQRQAQLYSAETGELLTVWNHPDIVEDLKFHPDGTSLLTACGDGKVRLWSLSSSNLVIPPMNHDDAVLAAAFSPDGKLIATGSRDLTVRFWETATGKPTGTILQHQAWVEDLAFGSNGEWLVTGCADGSAHTWSVITAEETGPPLKHPGVVRTVAIHPDGNWILLGGEDPRVTLWRVPSTSVEFPTNPELWVEAITGSRFSPSGTLSRLPTSEWLHKASGSGAQNQVRR